MMMTIDPGTGMVAVAAARLGPKLGEGEFLDSAIGRSATLVRQTRSRNFYQIWIPDASGRDFGAVLGFLPGGELQRIRLKLVRSEVRRRGVWSPTAENEMKVYHDRLLREQLGEPPYDFVWGWASSVIDNHDSAAVIIVAYGPRPK